jgi:hypothetical protein
MKYIVSILLLLVASVASGQSTDLFVMPGSDFTRPGTRANLNIGIGHSFDKLSKVPIGDEMTFSYTYENAGSHGFWHTNYGAHTEALGLMRNVSFGNTLGMYTWVQEGVTSFTGYKQVKNRLYTGVALGGVIHITGKQGIWIQETYNKIETTKWYTSTSIGYVLSW